MGQVRGLFQFEMGQTSGNGNGIYINGVWFLKNHVWKIKLEELHFLSISNLVFTTCVDWKNQVRIRQKIKFIQLDFSNSIFKKSSADQ